ncbi:hypothetical protein C8R44DRAFT_891857 [Mycena epipterygia]|nr:hypothetical protein C8R44DRAFT_891857 [Mycena epipterygia]
MPLAGVVRVCLRARRSVRWPLCGSRCHGRSGGKRVEHSASPYGARCLCAWKSGGAASADVLRALTGGKEWRGNGNGMLRGEWCEGARPTADVGGAMWKRGDDDGSRDALHLGRTTCSSRCIPRSCVEQRTYALCLLHASPPSRVLRISVAEIREFPAERQ